MKVAQLARRIAEKLHIEDGEFYTAKEIGGLDVDAAEAAALAHDLGHPPFGHIAEDELNKAMLNLENDQKTKVCTEGFEGNAQSFRLVTQLMIGDPLTIKDEQKVPFLGLNLTRVSLNAILKYPWFYGENQQKLKKWGSYDSEKTFFDFARKSSALGTFTKSLEAEIMDWADDITYAVHDAVDFYQAGHIPLERFAAKDEAELTTFFDEVFDRNTKYDTDAKATGKLFDERFTDSNMLDNLKGQYKSAFETVCDEFFFINILDSRYRGTEKQRLSIWQMMTRLITNYVGAIKVSRNPKKDDKTVEINKDLQYQIEMLKQLTWHYVILQPELATVQYGQRKLIRELFETLAAEVKKPIPETKTKLFPPFFEEQLKKPTDHQSRIRLVADFISGMTEKEVVTFYQKLFSHKVGPSL
jgi:dGTPase